MEGADPVIERRGSAATLCLPEDYLRWNHVLAEFFLLSVQPGQDVFLSVTPSSLARALGDIENEVLTPDDAQVDFKHAVASMYKSVILEGGQTLGGLGGVDADGVPQSVGFLGISVLAAYDQARGDEPLGRLRYYEPLSDALNCDTIGRLPRGFDLAAFDQLWEDLGVWVLEVTGGFLYLPRISGQHTAYPRLHALLRRVDIGKLPPLFEANGFEPGSRSVPPERIGRVLDGFARLTPDAKQALIDKRRRAVIEQVAAELEAWDGSVSGSRGTLKTSVQVHLRFHRDRPVLSYLPSRPAKFPEVFESDNMVFQAAEGQYYEAVPVKVTDGPSLQTGFEWRCGRFTLRRPAARVLALSPARELSDLVSQPGLPRGVRSAVLCVDELRDEVAAHLARITGRQRHPFSDPGLPEGWTLFCDVVAIAADAPPEGLEVLEVSDAVTIDFLGGLRLARSWRWLAGAPPRIVVSGPPDVVIEVDGEGCELSEGEVLTDSLSRVGSHRIRAGRLHRSVAVLEAEVSSSCISLVSREVEDVWTVPMPHGGWVILGTQPTDAMRATLERGPGLIRCPFPPVWAVHPQSGRGRRNVLCLVDYPPLPMVSLPSNETRLWSNAVRGAQQHLAGFESLGPVSATESDLRQVWGRYREASKTLRRRRRSGR